MLSIDIPGFGSLTIAHVVLDFNGTLAVDGRVLPGVAQALNALADRVTVHVVTADTFGSAAEALKAVNCRLVVLPPGRQDEAKVDVVNRLGAERTVSIGNGRNDALMLAASAVGIAVILAEGASCAAVASADVVCPSILAALDLLMHPLRLTATLRA